MPFLNNLFQLFKSARFVTLLCSLLLVSCGDSTTTAGIGGTGITSGEITGFGSVFVNGVEFNTDSSQFDFDGDIYFIQANAEAAGLAEGMVAKVYGTTDGNGVTGTATLLVYDDDIEGPVTSTPVVVPDTADTQKSFTIFNQTVIIDLDNTTFQSTSFDTLDVDDMIKISGLPISDTEILATYIKHEGTLVKGTSEVELSGIIDSLDTGAETFTLIGTTILIDYSTTPLEDIQLPGEEPAPGLFVEVDGIYDTNDTIRAIEIQEEEDDLGSDVDHISLEGIITDFVDTTNFTIDSQLVDASGAVFLDENEFEFIPTNELDDGVRVEVEGTIIGGVLFADEVELH